MRTQSFKHFFPGGTTGTVQQCHPPFVVAVPTTHWTSLTCSGRKQQVRRLRQVVLVQNQKAFHFLSSCGVCGLQPIDGSVHILDS
jgi:hypothetical protein